MELWGAWLNVFPMPQVSKAVDALTQGWHEMASRPKLCFNHKTHEPDLTLVLTAYLRDVISYKNKLLGYWSSEDNHGNIDFTTGKIVGRTRTDIGYHWNDDQQNYSVVFEFKKLDRHERSRKHYYGESGIQRFVTGSYSRNHPLAFMAGILVDTWEECVPPLRARLQQPDIAGLLQMCLVRNQLLQTPSVLFPNKAAFDTEHSRERGKAPSHGTILISHIFLPFGYAAPVPLTRKSHRKPVIDQPLESAD